MSTLQESVEARRAAKPAELACAVVASQGPTLTVSIWKGRSWVLPWSYLVAASLTDDTEPETLELSFTGHVVTVTGQNLRRVLDDLAGFRVACLRDLPPDYRARLPADAPRIMRIEVRPAVTPASGIREAS